MAQPLKQLPQELEENILSRLPPRSLVRFRAVCQRWNGLFNDKSFVNDHFSCSRPGFLFLGSPKNYSIDIMNANSIDPTIQLSLWNPWLRQFKLIEKNGTKFHCCGLGYEITGGRSNKVHKILGSFDCVPAEEYTRVAIYECASHVFKHIDLPQNKWLMFGAKENVSLNGNLFWLSREAETNEYFIRSFDFSVATFKPFCLLPCKKDGDEYRDALLLQVFKGDRLSLLKQNCVTRKIEIWVTNKVVRREEEVVVWTKMMSLLTTNFPRLLKQVYRKSYFVYDKTLFVCCFEKSTSVPCIYIVREDLCKRIRIDSGLFQCCHCVYTPSLIPVP
ncbi:F-box protein At3g17710-like [Raphanus sativus]|uniref:F-box protein At3g17710-like n=1 Tax=Raphanus sativus TaxID=3726 RepID=A0A9W3CHD5_RAPSA|nr:F-box protein At3g17710-like [Raphanus sativus]